MEEEDAAVEQRVAAADHPTERVLLRVGGAELDGAAEVAHGAPQVAATLDEASQAEVGLGGPVAAAAQRQAQRRLGLGVLAEREEDACAVEVGVAVPCASGQRLLQVLEAAARVAGLDPAQPAAQVPHLGPFGPPLQRRLDRHQRLGWLADGDARVGEVVERRGGVGRGGHGVAQQIAGPVPSHLAARPGSSSAASRRS